MIFRFAPGHGAPGLLASLWLEGSLGQLYPQCSRDRKGLHNLISSFSVSMGLPRFVTSTFEGVLGFSHLSSHINAETPGSIHKGESLAMCYQLHLGL